MKRFHDGPQCGWSLSGSGSGLGLVKSEPAWSRGIDRPGETITGGVCAERSKRAKERLRTAITGEPRITS